MSANALASPGIDAAGPEDASPSGIARALFFRGEAAKRFFPSVQGAPHDYRAIHSLMREAMACGRHRITMFLRVEGRESPCTIEALYFRALLLARISTHAPSARQLQIADTWIWMCRPALKGLPQPPAGEALRADLDSDHGLAQGPRHDDGPSLYLPQGILDDACHAFVRELHRGRIANANPLTSTFGVEEHMAVLALVRRALGTPRRAPGALPQPAMRALIPA